MVSEFPFLKHSKLICLFCKPAWFTRFGRLVLKEVESCGGLEVFSNYVETCTVMLYTKHIISILHNTLNRS